MAILILVEFFFKIKYLEQQLGIVRNPDDNGKLQHHDSTWRIISIAILENQSFDFRVATDQLFFFSQAWESVTFWQSVANQKQMKKEK